eukprot:g13272.t1
MMKLGDETEWMTDRGIDIFLDQRRHIVRDLNSKLRLEDVLFFSGLRGAGRSTGHWKDPVDSKVDRILKSDQAEQWLNLDLLLVPVHGGVYDLHFMTMAVRPKKKSDGHSCGIFAILAAAYLAHGLDLPQEFTKAELKAARQHLYLSVLDAVATFV